jgi:hypothetical protein
MHLYFGRKGWKAEANDTRRVRERRALIMDMLVVNIFKSIIDHVAVMELRSL